MFLKGYLTICDQNDDIWGLQVEQNVGESFVEIFLWELERRKVRNVNKWCWEDGINI